MSTESINLLSSQSEQLLKLQNIVRQAINEEKSIVEKLLNQPEEERSVGQKISDKVAQFGGSWNFIISFSVLLFIWIIFNSLIP